MPFYSLLIINKAGGLVYQKDFVNTDATTGSGTGVARLSTNEYLVLAGTFHGVHVITSKISPVPSSSGLQVLEADAFKLFCVQSPTGTKFLLVTDPAHSQAAADALARRIYEAFADYVMKNPFYTPEMPIRAELFDLAVNKVARMVNGGGAGAGGGGGGVGGGVGI
ncbi:Sybindin-like protein [Zopfochytrium polystomum]|nr:Sybindin-like protein [Zopfochytrium polystomum]